MNPVAQPVMTAAWWQASITSLILAIGAVLTALGVWDPTQDQIAVPLVGFVVHNKVTPVVAPPVGPAA